jgi:hypothetical protein
VQQCRGLGQIAASHHRMKNLDMPPVNVRHAPFLYPFCIDAIKTDIFRYDTILA